MKLLTFPLSKIGLAIVIHFSTAQFSFAELSTPRERNCKQFLRTNLSECFGRKRVKAAQHPARFRISSSQVLLDVPPRTFYASSGRIEAGGGDLRELFWARKPITGHPQANGSPTQGLLQVENAVTFSARLKILLPDH